MTITLAIHFKPAFIRQLNKLDADLQDEAVEKISLLKDTDRHGQLAVHKLHGQLKGRYSFSVNYKYRIVFQYLSKKEIVHLAIGDHEVYK